MSRTPGELIDGKYRLERLLGQGGMSEVWAARNERLDTKVAVKLPVLPEGDQAAAALSLERFRFEAQISARLGARTRHVVAVHDAGMDKQNPYLVMELVEGRTLEAELDEAGALDPLAFAEILDQVAKALTVAHAMGVVHRDLKPSNLLIERRPNGSVRVMLADFGLVKAVRQNLSLDQPKATAPGRWVGSPAYASPEQLAAKGKTSARTDLWSLGVVAYEALTGWVPFSGDSITELSVAITSRRFDPPSLLRSSLPRSIDAWFERALAKDPRARFETAGDMAAAFRAAVAAPGRARGGLYATVVLGCGVASLLVWQLTSKPTPPAIPAEPPVTSAYAPVLEPSPPSETPSVQPPSQPNPPSKPASRKDNGSPLAAPSTALPLPSAVAPVPVSAEPAPPRLPLKAPPHAADPSEIQ